MTCDLHRHLLHDAQGWPERRWRCSVAWPRAFPRAGVARGARRSGVRRERAALPISSRSLKVQHFGDLLYFTGLPVFPALKCFEIQRRLQPVAV
jgi:hypothetical protein